ncbi:hypothetical protein [Nocardia anaemiae]|uniref:hypothetical protein n=1 Tax=Nocardia anaemiae TaxID=263910 RepID=UPI0007A41091|nr:hypothetical protein [Nocardia anaemiae]
MSVGGGHTADARHSTFETELSAATSGRPLRMHVGLGPDTDSALITIALAHPDITDDMIATARRAFVTESVVADRDTEVPERPEEEIDVPGAAL